MLSSLPNIFEIIGLGEEYSSIYSVLLKKGKQRIIDIAKLSGVPRTSCYEYMPKLINLSLIEEDIVGKSKFYKCTSPQNLLSLVYKYKNDLSFVLSNLETDFTEVVNAYEIGLNTYNPEYINTEEELEEWLIDLKIVKVRGGIGTIKDESKINKNIIQVINEIKVRGKYVDLTQRPEATKILSGKGTLKLLFDDKIMIVNLESNSCLIIQNEELVKLELLSFENLRNK